MAAGWRPPRGHTCDVDGNDVCGHGLGRLSHLLLWGGEGRGLAPHLIFKLEALPCVALWSLWPHGELRFIILRWWDYGLESKVQQRWKLKHTYSRGFVLNNKSRQSRLSFDVSFLMHWSWDSFDLFWSAAAVSATTSKPNLSLDPMKPKSFFDSLILRLFFQARLRRGKCHAFHAHIHKDITA